MVRIQNDETRPRIRRSSLRDSADTIATAEYDYWGLYCSPATCEH